MQLAVLLLEVACLSALDRFTYVTATTLSTPQSDVATLDASTPSPLCRCNNTELVCKSRNESGEEEAVKLTEIVSWDCQFVKLEVSHLDVNDVAADAFDAKPDLQVVYLYSDFIETVDREAFKGLKSLVEVDLSDNSLLSVDPLLFANNPLLKSVSLSDNALVNLKTNAAILESTSITDLDLSFCKITTLSKESFSKLPSLERLDLANNNLQHLPLAALESMPRLNTFKIGNNRWRCDCAFKEVVEFTKTMEETDFMVRCFSPERLLETWSNKKAEKYCPDNGANSVIQAWMAETDLLEPPVDEIEEPTPENMGVFVFYGMQAKRKQVIITVVGVAVGFVIFVGIVMVVVRKMASRRKNGFYITSLSSSLLIPESKGVRDGQESSRISYEDVVNGHVYEKIPKH